MTFNQAQLANALVFIEPINTLQLVNTPERHPLFIQGSLTVSFSQLQRHKLMIERHQRIYILSWSFIHSQNSFPAYISNTSKHTHIYRHTTNPSTDSHTQISRCRPHSEQKGEEVTVSCGIPAVCLSLSMHFLFLCHTHTMTNTHGLSQSDRTLRSFQHVF